MGKLIEFAQALTTKRVPVGVNESNLSRTEASPDPIFGQVLQSAVKKVDNQAVATLVPSNSKASIEVDTPDHTQTRQTYDALLKAGIEQPEKVLFEALKLKGYPEKDEFIGLEANIRIPSKISGEGVLEVVEEARPMGNRLQFVEQQIIESDVDQEPGLIPFNTQALSGPRKVIARAQLKEIILAETGKIEGPKVLSGLPLPSKSSNGWGSIDQVVQELGKKVA